MIRESRWRITLYFKKLFRMIKRKQKIDKNYRCCKFKCKDWLTVWCDINVFPKYIEMNFWKQKKWEGIHFSRNLYYYDDRDVENVKIRAEEILTNFLDVYDY